MSRQDILIICDVIILKPVRAGNTLHYSIEKGAVLTTVTTKSATSGIAVLHQTFALYPLGCLMLVVVVLLCFVLHVLRLFSRCLPPVQ